MIRSTHRTTLAATIVTIAGLAASAPAQLSNPVQGTPLQGTRPAEAPLDANPTKLWIDIPTDDWNQALNNAAISGVERALDYGNTVKLLANSNTRRQLIDLGFAPVTRPATFTISIAGTTFDPMEAAPTIPAGLAAPDTANGTGLSLVQFEGPARSEWVQSLEDAGCQVVSYMHPHTYVIWATPEQRADATNRNASVRWSGDFLNAYKLRPEFRNGPAQPVAANILVVNHADNNRLMADIAAAEGVRRFEAPRRLTNALSILQVHTSADKLEALANINGVYAVQVQQTDGGNRGELTNQLTANRLDGSGLAFPGYRDFLDDAGFDGDGVIIAVVDSGTQESHPDLSPNALPCSGTTCDGSQSSHGTHTAGIAAGAGIGSTDSSGFRRGQGVAPAASIITQDYRPFFNNAGGMYLLMTDSARNGALISTNSWGPAGTPQGYDAQTLEVDTGARDADPDAPGNQELAYVLAIMNGNGNGSSGNNFSSLGTPDEAKNIIAVGSQDGQTGSGAQDPGYPSLSSNSAHGPALDGRLIPHLVAPGCDVDSATTGSGYTLLCGTSMAAPHVAGAAALWAQKFRADNAGADPSPAMIKAALAATADSLEGETDADGVVMGPPFDRKQGWGGLNLAALLSEDGSTQNDWDQEIIFDNTGEQWTTSLTPTDPSKPMRIMLAWTDALGHGIGGSTPAWNNDLDLIVQAAGNTYFGNNVGTGSVSTPGGSADFQNNLEGVILPAGSGGATITISAADINSDGIPGIGDSTDQDFALFCLNCDTGPGISVVIDGDTDICAPSEASLVINTSATGGFTGDVTLSAPDLPAGLTAKFSPETLTAGASASLRITGTGNLPSGDYNITILATQITAAPEPVTGSSSIGLNIANGTPSAVTGLSPSNGTSEVSLSPNFDWSDTPGAASYDIQITGADGNFTTPIEAVSVDNSEHTLIAILEPDTTYQYRVRAANTCGNGPWINASFTTRATPPVLLVDDDDNTPDVRTSYTAILDTLRVDYDIWDTNNSDNEPPTSVLAAYQAVIWFTGDEFGGASGPGSDAESALASYIDANDGSLLLSSQDYLYDRLSFGTAAPNPFMTTTLGLSNYDNDESQTSVTGAGSIFAGINTSLNYPFSNFSDIINPAAGSEVAFVGNQGNAGIATITEKSATVFLAFPLEAISSAQTRGDVLEAFLDAAIDTQIPCPTDFDGDGSTGPDDLFELLANFGTNNPDFDIDGDNTVGPDDLFALLAEFGNTCD